MVDKLKNLFHKKSYISKDEIRKNIDENIEYAIRLMDSPSCCTAGYEHKACDEYICMKKRFS